MKTKFVVRRFFAGLLTLPVALAGYFVAYALLVMLGTGPVGSWRDPVANFPIISIVWMLFWVFLPVVWRFAESEGQSVKK
jgi:ABC-type Fe3+ transport system permease subunit